MPSRFFPLLRFQAAKLQAIRFLLKKELARTISWRYLRHLLRKSRTKSLVCFKLIQLVAV